jgi:hypothetical protein
MLDGYHSEKPCQKLCAFFFFGLDKIHLWKVLCIFALDHDHDHHPHIATLSDKLERVINLSSCGI